MLSRITVILILSCRERLKLIVIPHHRAIAAVPGIDALFIGCADLSME